MSNTDNIGVMPDKFQHGAKEVSDIVPPLIIKTIDEAFSEHWDTDAHFVTYHTINNTGQEDWPRCTKNVLPQLRTVGVDLHTSMLVLDYDNPGHGKLTSETLAIFLNQLQTLADEWPLAWQWHTLYTTRNGVRIVYLLDQDIPVDLAERKHQWLCRQFIARGIAVDDAVSDWTRCFRLPFVMRDKTATWKEVDPPLTIHKQKSNRLCVDDIGEIEALQASTYGQMMSYDLPRPDHEEAASLLYHENASGQRTPTLWLTSAKRRLEGRECFDCLFKHKDIAARGRRNHTLARYIGQAMALVARMPGSTPTHIYALFLDPVEQLDPDEKTRSWTDIAWSLILRFWSKEEAKMAGVQDLIPEERDKKAMGMMDSIVEGMKKWCDEPILQSLNATSSESDKEKIYDWVRRRLIVSVGSNYWLMDANGYYDSGQLTRQQVIPRWRIKGMNVLYPTMIAKDNGKGFRDVGIDQLLNACATIAREVRAVPCLKGAYIQDIDTANAILIEPSYSRNAYLEALSAFNPDVDQWLRHLGGEHYKSLITWIQWALAFDEGKICGLSLSGAPGVGKQLLVQGLSECLTVPETANANDLVSANQYGLLKSPFLVVNEGWPKDHTGLHPADQFRHLVGGDPISVCRKYMAPVHVRNPVRVIFTANNTDVVSMLTAGRNLSPDDREALAIRLMHLKVTPEAAHWFRIKGGMSFTASPGNRWIAGDSGERSDYVVARHFLYLYQNRGVAPGVRGRFLVEGGTSLDVMFEMRTHSGASPIVIEVILKMLERPNLPEGIVVQGHEVYVLASEIISFFRQNMAQSSQERMTTRQVTNVLKGLVVAQSNDDSITLPGKAHLGRKRWHNLDLKLLIDVAQRDGWPCKRLDKIYSQMLEYKEADRIIRKAENASQQGALPDANFRIY